MTEQDIFRLCISGTGALLFFVWLYYSTSEFRFSIIISVCLFMISLGVWA